MYLSALVNHYSGGQAGTQCSTVLAGAAYVKTVFSQTLSVCDIFLSGLCSVTNMCPHHNLSMV